MYTVSADHNFHIGTQHLKVGKPCQDYAISGTTERDAFAIVSDGCSSGGHTDIGARLSVLATKNAIAAHKEVHRVVDPVSVSTVCVINLVSYQELLNLSIRDLLATNVWAVLEDRTDLTVHVTGDGVFAICIDGAVTAYRYEWHNNTPFYMAYERDPELSAGFKAHHGEVLSPLTCEVWDIAGEHTLLDSISLGAEEGMRGVTSRFTFPSSASECFVALFSDGVEQVGDRPWQDVVKSLLSFKSTSGAFVTRRMNRYLREEAALGNHPVDDIACAVIAARASETNSIEGEIS